MKRLLKAALAFAAVGAISLIVAWLNPATVDARGVLDEPFAWMVIGRLALVVAVLLAAVAAVVAYVRGVRSVRR